MRHKVCHTNAIRDLMDFVKRFADRKFKDGTALRTFLVENEASKYYPHHAELSFEEDIFASAFLPVNFYAQLYETFDTFANIVVHRIGEGNGAELRAEKELPRYSTLREIVDTILSLWEEGK